MNSVVVMDVERRPRTARTVSQHSMAVPTSRSSRRKDGVRKQINRTSLLHETPQLSHEQESERLHHALVSMSHGLLHYASQCAPWTPAAASNRSVQLHRLAAMQQGSVQRLCDLLIERGKVIDWNAFPTNYTSCNYVSLEFLWPKIADIQKCLVQILEAVRDELQHTPQATLVLDDIIQTEREISAELTSTAGTNQQCVSTDRKYMARSTNPSTSRFRGQTPAV